MMKPLLLSMTLAAALPLLAAAQQANNNDPNEAVARRFVERANAKDFPGMLACLAPAAKNFGRPVGPDGYRGNFEDLFSTFPDWRFDIIDTVAKGDDVVMRCKVTATHRGKGRLGIEPTGKHFETEQMHWFKVHDGKITDHYASRDDLGMFIQLGVMQPPGAPVPAPSATPK